MLTLENIKLKEKNEYLEKKMKEIIANKISQIKNNAI